MSANEERKHKCALQIVKLKEEEEDKRHKVECARRLPPQDGHHHHGGQFHKHPSEFVVDAESPLLGVHHAVAGVYEM